eukprot:tig00000786_g4053.t1
MFAQASRASTVLAAARKEASAVARRLQPYRTYSGGYAAGGPAAAQAGWSPLSKLLAGALLVGSVAAPTSAFAWFDRKKSTSASADFGDRLGPVTFQDVEVVLYQYDSCPYCNKVKAYLDYHKIPYKVVEVNPMYKREIKWSLKYQKVPILTVNGEALIESSRIIDDLDEMMHAKAASLKMKAPKMTADEEEEERKWRLWADSHYVHSLSPNIYRTMEEAYQAFEYISKNGNFGWWDRETARYFGMVAMYMIGWNIARKHGWSDVRSVLYEATDQFIDAIGPNRPFLGGNRPNKADLAMFGMTRAIEGLDTWKDLMQNTRMQGWYVRMQDTVGPSSRVKGEPTVEPAASKGHYVASIRDASRPQ